MDLITTQRIAAIAGMRNKDKLESIRDLLVEEITGGQMDFLIEILLDAMSLVFVVNKNFRRNIKNFRAKFVFKSDDGKVGVSAIFKPSRFFRTGRMHVKSDVISDPDITVRFRDGKSMAEFLFSENPDIISGMLDDKLSFRGNLNYILKFAYMARHLPRELGIHLQV